MVVVGGGEGHDKSLMMKVRAGQGLAEHNNGMFPLCRSSCRRRTLVEADTQGDSPVKNALPFASVVPVPACNASVADPPTLAGVVVLLLVVAGTVLAPVAHLVVQVEVTGEAAFP